MRQEAALVEYEGALLEPAPERRCCANSYLDAITYRRVSPVEPSVYVGAISWCHFCGDLRYYSRIHDADARPIVL